MSRCISAEGWWAIAVGAIFVALFVSMGMSETAKEKAQGETIKACIQQGKSPVISYGELKECK